MPDQAPNIESFSGGGRLVYDKKRRTIVAQREMTSVPRFAPEPCPCCGKRLQLNRVSYTCEQQSSSTYSIDDLR